MSEHPRQDALTIAPCPGDGCVRLVFGVTTIHLTREDFRKLLTQGWKVLQHMDAAALTAPTAAPLPPMS